MKVPHTLKNSNVCLVDRSLCGGAEIPSPIAVRLIASRYRISIPHAATVAQLAGVRGLSSEASQ